MISLFMDDKEFDNAIEAHQKARTSKAVKPADASFCYRTCSKKEREEHKDKVKKMNKLSRVKKVKIVIFRG